jgi:hypothetical protein
MKTLFILLKGLIFERSNKDSKKISNEFFDLDDVNKKDKKILKKS